MTIKTGKNKNTSIALTITLISLITVTSIMMVVFSQSSFGSNTDTISSQLPKQSSLPSSAIGIKAANNLKETNFVNSSSSTQSNIDLISSNTLKFNLSNYSASSVQQPDMTQPYFSFPDNIKDQITGSDVTLPTNPTDNSETNSFNWTNLAGPISLQNSNFTTYTYGGCSVQQPNLNQFNFSFPDKTNEGQLAGSDAFGLNTCTIQKIDFDAAFITPKINALGFEEMAIFATSNTVTYKGTEFGIRMDLKDGFVYGYIQEPEGNNGDVNFQMLVLASNDGIMHHYTLIVYGTGVSFCIDGKDCGYLNFPSNTDYSNLSYFILAVVHRFTDYWDSDGDNMIVGNFTLNQQ